MSGISDSESESDDESPERVLIIPARVDNPLPGYPLGGMAISRTTSGEHIDYIPGLDDAVIDDERRESILSQRFHQDELKDPLVFIPRSPTKDPRHRIVAPGNNSDLPLTAPVDVFPRKYPRDAMGRAFIPRPLTKDPRRRKVTPGNNSESMRIPDYMMRREPPGDARRESRGLVRVLPPAYDQRDGGGNKRRRMP